MSTVTLIIWVSLITAGYFLGEFEVANLVVTSMGLAGEVNTNYSCLTLWSEESQGPSPAPGTPLNI